MKLVLILMATIFSASAFASEPTLMKEIVIIDADMDGTRMQLALSEKLRSECLPKTIDIVDMDYQASGEIIDDISGDYKSKYEVKVTGICR